MTESLKLICFHGARSEKNDGHTFIDQPDLRGKLKPIHPRKHDVEDADVERTFPESPETFFAVVANGNVVAAGRKILLQKITHVPVIFHKQH
jgi:hypothetical protein